MAAANLNAAPGENTFDPSVRFPDLVPAKRTGKRRQFERQQCRAWLWPKTRPLQRDAFKAWKLVADQIIREARYEHRTLAVFVDFINWKTGCVFASDRDLGRAAGGFCEKTASRDIAAYKAMGIIAVTHGWRRQKNGKFKRTRTISLAVPTNLPPSVTLSGIENHTDHSGLITFESISAPTVAIFPLAFRTALVRRTAAELASRNRYQGQQWWAAHVKRERAALRQLGLSPQQIDAEISRYATAISRVLHLQKQYGATPDGAA